MSDYATYRQEFDRAEVYFKGQIADREGKAYEYGMIVVRNAVLISGGGLLAIPAIVGLSGETPINTTEAAIAGVSLTCALLFVIVGAYVIHLNWTFHAAAWEKLWEDRQEFLRKAYLEDVELDQLDVDAKSYFENGIKVTFWVPHALAILYLFFVGYGFFRLYSALGVSP